MPRRQSQAPSERASSGPMAPAQHSWAPQSPAPGPPPYDGDEIDVQVRLMCLKVHYTFDKDSQVRCLARWPQVLPIRAVPLDEQNTIGLVELGVCLQAVAQGSPEIISQPDLDYTVYAYDYSEPDTPLVGQGILAWAINGSNDAQSPQMLTGRVTRNPLAVFSSGVRETLEVKLKLTAVPKMQRPGSGPLPEPQIQQHLAPTPTDTSEWNSFIQSNPTLGRSAPVASVPSPAPMPVHAPTPTPAPAQARVPTPLLPAPQSSRAPRGPPTPVHDVMPLAPRRGSLPPSRSDQMQSLSPAIEMARLMPADDASAVPPPAGAQYANKKPARSSSRASRSKEPTGKPRGRPRRRPPPTQVQMQSQTGNTSAAEEGTDADDGPQRKRAKITKADLPASGPFGTASDSLRVAASTAGSLRNMRPVAVSQDPTAASHLQEIPRVPTPIPQGSMLPKQPNWNWKAPARSRRESMADVPSPAAVEMSQPTMLGHTALSQDGRSPRDWVAAVSPDQSYTPADSPADIGSSPPVPRAATYLQSSPPAQSSPVLPPMLLPMEQPDSGFMSGGMEDFFDHGNDELPQELPPSLSSKEMQVALMEEIANQSHLLQRPGQSLFNFQEVQPGPPELLPTTSIFKPHGAVKRLNNPNARPPRKRNANLTRANTEPIPAVPDSQVQSEPPAPMCDPLPDFIVPPNQSARRAESVAVPGDRSDLVPPESDIGDGSDERLSSLQEAERQNKAPGPAIESGTNLAMAREPNGSAPALPAPVKTERRDSLPPIPASDPVLALAAALPESAYSEALCPPSDAGEISRYNKNLVKKQTIKEKLENAIDRGEMPPFCQNCGAIETPTWRKIWTQDHDGVPEFYDYSEKPGHVTAIEILERDADDKPKRYRLVKKNLGRMDDKQAWTELLLCNPCGIWLAKFKNHRPADRWEKDAARLNQPRKRREHKPSASRSKRARTKSDAQFNPTSEAYLTTDPMGQGDGDVESPPEEDVADNASQAVARENSSGEEANGSQAARYEMPSLVSSPRSLGFGSTHSRNSRGSGTADSPIPIEDDLGATRRLLFPSPRKDGVTKVLGELAVNVVHVERHPVSPKAAMMADKENLVSPRRCLDAPALLHDVLLDHELFGTPPVRPSTPPPKTAGTNNQPFKTPTRATPGQHRPITRSISRTIQSAKSLARSPGQLDPLLLQTPSKTPRIDGGMHSSSALKKRTPKMQPQHLHAHFMLDGDDGHHVSFDSPFTATLHQLLSEANDFTADSSSHGLVDLDLASLPNLDSEVDAQNHHHHHHLTAAGGAIDFGTLFSTDVIMPSSPPLLRGGSGSTTLSGMTLGGESASAAMGSIGSEHMGQPGKAGAGGELEDLSR